MLRSLLPLERRLLHLNAARRGRHATHDSSIRLCAAEGLWADPCEEMPSNQASGPPASDAPVTSSATAQAEDLARRTIKRRAVKAVLWPFVVDTKDVGPRVLEISNGLPIIASPR